MTLQTATGTAPTRGSPVKTAAEQTFADNFAAAASKLPGAGWVSRLRNAAIEAFAARGLPSRRLEEFKYTDLRERLKSAHPPATAVGTDVTKSALDAALGPLAQLDAHRIVFAGGQLRAELSSLEALTAFAEAMPLGPLLAKAPSWLEEKFAPSRLGAGNAITDLNAAFMSDGLLIKVKPGFAAAKPVLLITLREGEAATHTLRHIVAMEAGSKLTLIEADIALDPKAQGLANTLTDVTVADGASLDHIRLANPGTSAQSLATSIVHVGTNADYRAFQLTCDTALARNTVNVRLAGQQSRLDISGSFLARGSEHIDTTLVVDHLAPHCESRELFKMVLDDRARGVFQGRINVAQGADKTDGKQMAKALMLSEDAEFDSKPELEIFADDVACGHGSTCAELDPELMFYCRSRGIPETEARALLIEAFIGDAVEKVRDESVRSALMAVAQSWLRKRTARNSA